MGLSDKASKFFSSQDKKQLLQEKYLDTRVKLFKKIRLSSKPFISGDTFRAMADVKLDRISKSSISRTGRKIQRLFKRSKNHVILFIDLHCTLDTKDQVIIKDWLRELERLPNQKLSIVFHNHDIVPPLSYFQQLVDLGMHCYCPNVLDNTVGIIPIPLGIENRYFQRNGVVRYFPKNREYVMEIAEQRSVGLFASFNIRTNPITRQQAADSVLKHGFEFSNSRIQPREFRKKLSESLFVLSPPGNGIDCHRTWEAIYFGSIPVIKKGMLAESLYKDMPIFAVDDWDEICTKHIGQLEDLYMSFIKISSEKGYFAYWEQLIKS